MKPIIQLILFYLVISGQVIAQEVSFKKHYINHTEFGGLFGRVKFKNEYNSNQEQVDSKLSLTIQTYNGIQLSNRLSTGVMVGMDWYKTALINPIAVGARYDLTKGKAARLYATADVGYGFAWFHDDSEGYNTKGGLMINPGFGIKYGKPGGAAFTIGVTYKRQEVSVTKPPMSNQTERSEERVYNRMALRLGMSF